MMDLDEYLKEHFQTPRLFKETHSSSRIGVCYMKDDGSKVLVKKGYPCAVFEGELESLKKINATKTIRVPKGLEVIHYYDGEQSSAILMECLDTTRYMDAQTARLFGRDLARLHDYNNKVIRFNLEASKWVGNKVPSTKRSLLTQAKNAKRQKSDGHHNEDLIDNDVDANEDEDLSTRGGTDNLGMPQQSNGSTGSKDNDESHSEKFVPELGTCQVNDFGFDVPTYTEPNSPQVNEWTRDWVSFYARHRLDYKIRKILSESGDRELSEQWSHLQNKIDKFFSDFEHRGSDENVLVPALLHGNFWPVHVAQLSVEGEQSVGIVYNPASFYGHSEYDLASLSYAELGYQKEFEQGYFDELPKRKLFAERNKLYQLYHVLDDWYSGERITAITLMESLNSSA